MWMNAALQSPPAMSMPIARILLVLINVPAMLDILGMEKIVLVSKYLILKYIANCSFKRP